MQTIKQLEAEIANLEALIRPHQDRISVCEQEILKLKSPFVAGDIIEWRGGRRGRVLGIHEWCCGDPAWRVVNIRKDGSEGSKREVRSYDQPKLIKKTEAESDTAR